MKPSYLLLLIVLSLCTCKSDKTITPQEYDGEYPYAKSTGNPIPTYRSQFISSWQLPPVSPVVTPVSAVGQYRLMFKNHDWNHWPFIVVNSTKFTKTPSAFEYMKSPVLETIFVAQSEYYCSTESVSFAIPAKMGRYQFGQGVDYSHTNPSFYSFDCDAPKDRIEADRAADNWVNVARLDTLNKQVEGSFDLSFKVVRKDIRYSIVYPTHIRMRGSFSGPLVTR